MDVNQRLLETVGTGNLEEVQRLIIVEKASINVKDDKKQLTPLHYAVRHGHLPVVEYLINVGASIDVKDDDGWTPLHCAASRGYLPIVECLINAGASIDAKDNNGWTALHLAARYKYLPVVKYLLKVGADYRSTTNDGFTPKQITNVKEIEDLLQEYEEDCPEEIKEPDCS